MFKAGDKLNPYDPASLEFEDPMAGVAARMAAGNSPLSSGQLERLTKDPAAMAALVEMLKQDAEERKRTGETPEEQMIREKREWAEADARSVKIKLEANDAFRKGDFTEAFVLYTVCCRLSAHDPVYWLNRAAASLKLRLFAEAIDDLELPIDRNFNLTKAYFRRGQAYRFLGDFVAAERDLKQAYLINDDDPSISKELEEVKALQDLDDEEQKSWIGQQDPQTVDGLFGAGELRKLVDARIH